ncbi:MAG: hypothetical protein A4E66_00298 [Syntrophus sp. PtaB.Bin001]|nr:MAG: hypothetical protein A4E66_00298 [Syntrophus sp. PtaB.Bin001]
MYFRNREHDFLNRLAPYALKSVHSNEAYRIPINGEYVFVKVYGPKKPRFMYEIRCMLNRIGMRQPIEYRPPRKRKECEESYLRHWREKGFHVPEIVVSPFPKYEDVPHLSTTFVNGVTLKSLLQKGYSSSEKNLINLFTDMSKRHQLAFRTQDNLLFHVDANTQNILAANNLFVHVDFEMGHPWEALMESACREVSKLLISVGEDLKPNERELVYSLFKKCYRNKELLDSLASSVSERPFQKFHRWRNKRKKIRDPRRVTLYDLVDTLRSVKGNYPGSFH